MNISKRYAWQSTGNCHENNPLLPQSLWGLVIGKSGCGKTTVIFNLLLQPGWQDYNHLYIFEKSLHQQEYKILRKGFEGGLSKRQISNVFNRQEMLQSPLIAIEKYSGVRNGGIRADFYDDCQNIPDPSALDPTQNNLLLLYDCFFGKQNKAEAYYTRGRHNNCDTIYIAQNYFRLPRHTTRENSNFSIIFPQNKKNLTHIHADHCAGDIALLEFKQISRVHQRMESTARISIDSISQLVVWTVKAIVNCNFKNDYQLKYVSSIHMHVRPHTPLV